MENLKFTVTSKINKKFIHNDEYLFEMEKVTIFSDISEELTYKMFSNNEAVKEILLKSLTGYTDGVYNVRIDCVIIFDFINTEHNATFRVLHWNVDEVKPLLH